MEIVPLFSLPFYPVLSPLQGNHPWRLNSQALTSRVSKLLWERSAGRRLHRDYFLRRSHTRWKGFPGNRIMHMAVSLRELQAAAISGCASISSMPAQFLLDSLSCTLRAKRGNRFTKWGAKNRVEKNKVFKILNCTFQHLTERNWYQRREN